MKRKEKKQEGAADWLVTYGDMMTLLLCFFVILVSLSEMKQDERFDKVMESIKRAFGYKGGAGTTPGTTMPNNTFDKKMTQLIMRKFQLQVGKSSQEGIEGENPSVKTIREGLEFTFSGLVSFELGKARLLDRAKKELSDFAIYFKGINTKIRIKGHTAHKPEGTYKPFGSLDELAYARATAVKDFLVQNGIREERITVEACGDNEPLMAQAYDESTRAMNRRVSVIVTENIIQQYKGSTAQSTEKYTF